MLKKSRVFLSVVLTFFTLSIVAFIFYNSLQSAEASDERSDGLLKIINNIFESLGINLKLNSFIIRKTAHLTEFFCLSTMINFTLVSYKVGYKKRFFVSLLISFVVLISDECIQMFSSGRSCEVRDMIIDFCGALLAAALFLFISFLVERRKKKKINGTD